MSRDQVAFVTSGTGASEDVYLPGGEWSVTVTSSSWGEATLEAANSTGDHYQAVTEGGGPVVFTENDVKVVLGGLRFRLNVTSHPAAITFVAERLVKGNQ